MSTVPFDIADARKLQRWADRVEVLINRRRQYAAALFEESMRYTTRAGWALGVAFGSQSLGTILAIARTYSWFALADAAMTALTLFALTFWQVWRRRADRLSSEAHRLRGCAEGLAECIRAFVGDRPS